ncbi:DUF6090 family protein [Winogradskyella sp. A3E31]|uniref:DUF6090 family protein n=1 Tax=Winogradskyella sp. A3E31 TaxID=3349637 RepID=UPI00398B6289
MIKFFRQIRFKLMEQKKTSRYFKYAIGEIILVVIGILIALQINNWNEHRKQLRQQDLLFNQLLSDAKADSIFFQDRLRGLSILDSTLTAIRQFEDNPDFDISTINTNGTGNLFPMSSFRHNSNLLANNEEVYKELLDFEIKSTLREYRAKYEYIVSSYSLLNAIIESNWLEMAKKYYKELRSNKANKSEDALKVIYQDHQLLSSIDLIMERSDICKTRTKEILVINAKMLKTLKKMIRNDK